MKKRMLIIGDSHTHSFKRFFKVHGQDDEVEVLTFAKLKNDILVGDELPEDINKKLENSSEYYRSVISLTGGNQHNSISLIKHREGFSIASSDNKGYVGDLNTKLPRETFKFLFRKGLKGGDFKKLKDIKGCTGLPIYHVAAPPPKKSTEHILKRPESDFVRKNIVESGVTDAYVRLEIYKIQMEVTRELCEELEIEFVRLPESVTDKDGFLAEQYYADDATHANKDFAEVMLSHLKSLTE